MADLSRVLQALGAILQGGGGTLTAIDEDRRRRELDERNTAYFESLIANNKAAQDRAARQDAMEGWIPGSPPPLGSLSVPNPMGSGPGVELAGRPDPRIEAGGMYRDPTVASPNQEIEMQQALREGRILAQRTLADLQKLPQYTALSPEEQEQVRGLAEVGYDVRALVTRMDLMRGEQRDSVIQEAAFQAGKVLAQRYGFSWDAEYMEGQDYDSQLRSLRGSESGALIGRAINPPSSGDGGLSFTRMQNSAIGDARDLAAQRKTIDQIADALAPDYPDLTSGELRIIAQDAYRDVRESSGTGANRVPSILDSTPRAASSMSPAAGGAAQRFFGGNQPGGSAFDKMMGQ